ncbi:MAG: flagellar motor switch protein FliN [Planctomycetaceae bacterium]|nr:flagellar motor switch protein FliN [Planctomycetaceae bacterium]
MTEALDAVMAQIEQELDRHEGDPASAPDVAARAPSFAQLTPSRSSSGKSLDHLYGVRLDAEAVLGRANLSVEDMLNLGIGSVVELNRLLSEPVDLIVQNVRVARGEVVVVNDQFAIRITEITDSKH